MVFPFKSVENYPQMLNQLALYVFVETLIILSCFLRFEPFKNLNENINKEISILNNNIPILILGVSLIVAIISRLLPFHDKISDLFGIRKKYDLKNILIPLSKGVGLKINNEFKRNLEFNRSHIMYDVFYKYASSTKDSCKIDHHNVIMVLTGFTGFWITIEALCLTIPSMIISLIIKDILLFISFGLVSLFLFLVRNYFINKCKKHTSKEVEEILSNPKWANRIKQTLNAIQNR